MSTLKANTITATDTNANLVLQGNGTGKVAIGDGSLLMPDADGSAGQFIKTDGSGTLSFDTVASGRTVSINQKALGYYASTSINALSLPILLDLPPARSRDRNLSPQFFEPI